MEKLIDTVLDCATNPVRWNDAMDSFCQTFGVKSAMLYSVNNTYDIAPQAYVSAFLRTGAAAQVLKDFAEGKIKGDEKLFDLVFRLPPGQFFSESEILGVDGFADLPPSEIRDATLGIGIYSRSGALLNRTGPWSDIVSFHTSNAAQERAALTDTRASLVLRIVERSVELQRIFDTLRARYRAALSVLDRLGLGVILVTPKGQVVLSNTEAQRIADLDDGISITAEGRLSCQDPDRRAQLQTLVSAAAATTDMPSKPATLTIPRPSGKFDFIISTGAINDSLAELEPGLQCGVVIMIDPSRPQPLDVRGAALLGKLTPAETEIAAALVTGASPSAVAESRDTSLHTIRTQIKALSAKLRCHSQADIIRLAAATRLPLDDS